MQPSRNSASTGGLGPAHAAGDGCRPGTRRSAGRGPRRWQARRSLSGKTTGPRRGGRQADGRTEGQQQSESAAASSAPARIGPHSMYPGADAAPAGRVATGAGPTCVIGVSFWLVSTKPQGAQNEHHDHDEADEVDDAVHVTSPCGARSAAGLCEFTESVPGTTP